ncbi:MAG: rRNA adenine N-6-methyltransferase family protein [Victivallaceae bacterium]|nr:rRNA adenine N-6-methyltransferase family protein [Victivallaceae bacterium]
MTKQLFFKRFLANPGLIGALCPSSPALCREMIAGINIECAETVIELGPGTGVITDEILACLHPRAKFIAVELDHKMYENLRKNRPQVNIVNDSAENLSEIMENAGVKRLNAVVSGLPWAAFPVRLQKAILGTVIESLAPDGYFTTFAYLQGLLLPAGQRFRKLLKNSFREVNVSRVVWQNVPPAIVYRCRK